MLTEFRRDVSIGVTPAAWIREEHIEWGAGEYADYAFFHNADCDTLTLVRDRPVSQDLIHFHKYTDPMLVRGEEAVKWPPTALEASQMGRWVSGQGDAEDMAFMLWELVLLDSKDFELSLFLYDSKDLQRAWSLGFRFTGQINMKDGVLVAKKAYRVYNGTLQDVSNAETVQVAIRNDVVINYTEQCDRLTLLLPQEESAFMVLRFHSEQSRGTEKE